MVSWSHSLTLSLRSHHASAQMTKNASAPTHTSQVKWGFKLDSDGTRTSYTMCMSLHKCNSLAQITLNETTSRSLGVVAPIHNDKKVGGRDETDGELKETAYAIKRICNQRSVEFHKLSRRGLWVSRLSAARSRSRLAVSTTPREE